MESFEVKLDLPLPGASANSRMDHRVKGRDVRLMRTTAWAMAKKNMPKDWSAAKVRIHAKFFCIRRFAHERVYIPRDYDNATISLKPYIDGLVDAGVVPDDSRKHLSFAGIEFVEGADCDKKDSGVLLRVEAVEIQ